jgi:hypothetical protein
MLRLLATSPLVLIVAGCSAAGGLFGGSNAGSSGDSSLFGKGVSAIADHGSDIFDAAEKAFSGPSYCQKSGSTQVYKVDDGDCTAGDTAIKSYAYNQRVAANQQAAWDQLHAAAQAEAKKPVYCETTTSHTAYRPLSNQCQAGEQTISEQQYDAAKTSAAAAQQP